MKSLTTTRSLMNSKIRSIWIVRSVQDICKSLQRHFQKTAIRSDPLIQTLKIGRRSYNLRLISSKEKLWSSSFKRTLFKTSIEFKSSKRNPPKAKTSSTTTVATKDHCLVWRNHEKDGVFEYAMTKRDGSFGVFL